MRRLVMFELNEVPWRILDWWVDCHHESAIADLLGKSSQWTSISPDDGHLSPWVTWPTVHRGVANTVHGISHLGQDTTSADAIAPPWWQLAAEAGRRVGVFGLLHTGRLPADTDAYDLYVPDTFATEEHTHPRSIEAFQHFNLRMARESARNVSTAIDWRTAASFLVRAPRLGLRPATAFSLGRQLISERRHPHTRVRRRSYQSVVAFDIFLRQLRMTRPDAAAFFTNHVASAMHRYWAATFPDDYPAESFAFDDEWVARWSGELDEAMRHADRMVARLVAHAERTDSVLIVASSMGQQAAQATPVRSQLYVRDIDRFVTDAGVDPAEVARRPAMDPDVSLQVDDPDAKARLRARLEQLTVGNQPISWSERDPGFFAFAFGQADEAIGTVAVAGEARDPAELGLEIVEIEDAAVSTGYHIPHGALVAYDPRQPQPVDTERREVPTTAIAPGILALLDVPVPEHMDAGGAWP